MLVKTKCVKLYVHCLDVGTYLSESVNRLVRSNMYCTFQIPQWVIPPIMNT